MVEVGGRHRGTLRLGGAVNELQEIRQGVSELRTALALHDQKVEADVERIVDSQDRLVAAVERIGDATIAIKALTDQMRTNGKNGKGGMPWADKKVAAITLGVLLVASFVAGGGAELMRALLELARR